MSELDDEKKFYERFNALHNDPMLSRIAVEFGIAAFRRSSVLEGFDAFLRRTAFTGTCCVEIGTCNGLTAIVLARYFKRVVSVDNAPNVLKHEVLRFSGLSNVEFHDVRSNAEKAVLINGLVFDAAYVDGDHARDTETDFALVARGGRALFHEYWSAQPPVVKLVDSLRSRGTVQTEGKLALWIA